MTIRVIIKLNDIDEFEVPTPSADAPDSIYFTDDREDALLTARRHHGVSAELITRRGTYQEI